MTAAVVALALALAGAVGVLTTFAVLYARAVRGEATESSERARASIDLAALRADLAASQEQRARLVKAVARYSREMRELQEYWISVGDDANPVFL